MDLKISLTDYATVSMSIKSWVPARELPPPLNSLNGTYKTTQTLVVAHTNTTAAKRVLELIRGDGSRDELRDLIDLLTHVVGQLPPEEQIANAAFNGVGEASFKIDAPDGEYAWLANLPGFNDEGQGMSVNAYVALDFANLFNSLLPLAQSSGWGLDDRLIVSHN